MAEKLANAFGKPEERGPSFEILNNTITGDLSRFDTESDIPLLEERVHELWEELEKEIDYQLLAATILSVPNADFIMARTGYCTSEDLKTLMQFEAVAEIVLRLKRGESISKEDLVETLLHQSWLSNQWPKATEGEQVPEDDSHVGSGTPFTKVISELTEAAKLIYLYSESQSEYELIGKELKKFINVAVNFPNISQLPGLQRTLISLLEDYLSTEGLEDVSEEEVLDTVVLQGFDQDTEKKVIVNKLALRNWLRLNIPMSFLRGLSSIVHLDTVVKEVRGDGAEMFRVGEYRPYDSSIVVVGNTITLEELSTVEGGRLRDLLPRIEDGLVTTTTLEHLTHEIGHHFHDKLFTLRDLAAWQNVVEQEQVSVSDYSRDTAHYKPVDARKEDFAESFRMFVAEPARLKQVAPLRFEYMKALFEKYGKEQFKPRLLRTALGKAYLADAGLGSG